MQRDSVTAFFARNPIPEGWAENLNAHLPTAGEVSLDVPLVRIVDGRGTELAMLRANQVCTLDSIAKINAFPPDGIWCKWGDAAEKVVPHLLAEALAKPLVELRLPQVPEHWRIEYGWLRQGITSDFQSTAKVETAHE